MLDVAKIKEDFPIFQRIIKGKNLIYLDSAATTQKPKQVIEAISNYYKYNNANVHRGAYTLSEESTAMYENARQIAAEFINASSSRSIVFTRNATEAINLVANAWGLEYFKPNDEILLTQMEHHSNLIPWQLIAKKTGAKLKFIYLDQNGKLDLRDINDKINKNTKFVSLVQISNSLGTINPVKYIIKLAHTYNVPIMIDATQSVPHTNVDVQELDCDFLVFSGHKMLGPTGIGVLYGKEDFLDKMPPYMGGGEMINEVHLDWADYRSIPWKFEAGTPNISGAIGLAAAIKYINSIGKKNIEQHEKTLTKFAIEELTKIDGVEIYGPLDDRGPLVAFNIKNVHPHDVSTILDEFGVAIRAGHHCTQPIMQWLNVPATVRASFYIYNSLDDIDVLIRGIKKTKEIFASVS